MELNLFILGLFVLALIFIASRARDSVLSKLELSPGESILFEEDGVKVYQLANEDIYFKNCRIRVTDQRLIIAQKFWGRDKYALRFVFHVPSVGDTSLRGLYVTSHLQDEQILIDAVKGEIRMPLGNSVLTETQLVVISTSRVADWRARLPGAREGGAGLDFT